VAAATRTRRHRPCTVPTDRRPIPQWNLALTCPLDVGSIYRCSHRLSPSCDMHTTSSDLGARLSTTAFVRVPQRCSDKCSSRQVQLHQHQRRRRVQGCLSNLRTSRCALVDDHECRCLSRPMLRAFTRVLHSQLPPPPMRATTPLAHAVPAILYAGRSSRSTGEADSRAIPCCVDVLDA